MGKYAMQYKAFDFKTGNTYLIGAFYNKADARAYCKVNGIVAIAQTVVGLTESEYKHALANRKDGEMKEQTLYICELCKTRYSDRKEAENCEKAHIKPKKLTKKMGFHAYKSGKDPILTGKEVQQYPDWIEIEMADGNIVRYKR